MLICVVKHSESERRRQYKGRIWFQGNNVFDQDGLGAVFSEQGTSGTSASHQTAGKWLDALARVPGNSGQDVDATSAYT